MSFEQKDIDAIELQLGRTPRGVIEVANRCQCGKPTVVATKPVLSDGEPFPTHFYLTCANLNSMIGTLEASGLMKEYEERLKTDKDLKLIKTLQKNTAKLIKIIYKDETNME